jgi:hypothetical protein
MAGGIQVYNKEVNMNLQFRCLDDLKEVIKEYEGWLARPTRYLSHPTLYRMRDVQDKAEIIKGIRIKDWLFSEDMAWVLPHNQMGLSFSSSWQHLKGIYKLKQRHNPLSKINVYWRLQKVELPAGLKWENDQRKSGHVLLTVSEKMTLDQLIKKLKSIALNMSVIKDAGVAL